MGVVAISTDCIASGRTISATRLVDTCSLTFISLSVVAVGLVLLVPVHGAETPHGCPGRTLTTLQEVYQMSKEQCETVEGPLFIEDLICGSYHPPAGSSKLPSLDTVERITQFLVVQRIRESNYTCLTQLLPNLKSIGGCHLYEDRWALVFRDNVHLFINMSIPTKRGSRKDKFFFIETLLSDQGTNCPELAVLYDPTPTCQDSTLCKDREVEGYRCADSCVNLTVADMDWEMGSAVVKSVSTVESVKSAICLVSCDAPNRVVTDIQDLRYLKDCQFLNGSLRLSLSVSSMDMYSLEQYLGGLREISGYLFVFRSWGMDSLQFLQNLDRLNTAGELWQGRYSLALYDNPDLSQLWKGVKNLTVGSGAAYLQATPRLCSMDIEALNKSFTGRLDGNLAQYPQTTCDLNQLNVTNTSSSLRWHWTASGSDMHMDIAGQFMYHIELRRLIEMTDSVNSSHFQEWLVDHGSPGNLADWDVFPINSNASNLTINQIDWNIAHVFHLRAFTISENQPEIRSGLYIHGTFVSDKTATTPKISCATGLSSQRSLMISNISDCCAGRGSNYSSTLINWDLGTSAYSIEVEHCRLDIDINRLDVGNIQDNVVTKRCFETCPYQPSVGKEVNFPRQVSVVKQRACGSANQTGCSRNVLKTSYANLTALMPFSVYSVQIRKRISNTKCGPWSPPVVLLTAPAEAVDEARDLSISYNRKDNKIVASWSKPFRPNGGQVSHYCVVIGSHESNLQFDSTTDGNNTRSCRRGLSKQLLKLLSTFYLMRIPADNDTVTLQLPLREKPVQKENILLLVQTIAQYKWQRGQATVNKTLPIDPHDQTDTDNTWIAGVVVCCVVTCLLIPSLAVAIKYGRRKRRQADRLQDTVHYYMTHGLGLNYSNVSLDGVYLPDEWEVDESCVKMYDTLGEGAFGTVYAGSFDDEGKQTAVAIKTLRDDATQTDKMQFLKESSLMKKLDSDNVVRLLGIVSQSERILVLMELMANGDLKHYLQSIRPQEGRDEKGFYSCYPLSEHELVQMAAQIAAGMEYLHSKRFIHRDLAARNCMVAKNSRVIKIGDFGMARDIYSSDYYVKHGQGPMPIRWMAPESLQDGVFTNKSDVWSYGIVLWEMVMLGCQPYPGQSNQDVFHTVMGGHTMDIKSLPHCPVVFMMLMERCWMMNPQGRHEFRRLKSVLLLDQGAESSIPV